ncbi:MAG: LysM domain-containing protein, partial [Clostridia bacterium]|nr:LysM domain-containing protein [Clostridia bacterium]
FFGTEKGTVITDAIMGEPLPIKEEAIEIYFAKAGDNLWEIAKELRTQPDVIIEQNPDFVSPLLENKNIMIYHQKNTNPTSAILGKKTFDY